MNATVSFTGLENVLAALGRLPERTLTATGGALYREAEGIMADSKEHYVPVDLGVLRDSGFVELPKIDRGRGVSVAIGYGGAAADYAAVQHEDLTLNHPNGGEAKFLEKPLLLAAEGLAERVAAEVKDALGGTA